MVTWCEVCTVYGGGRRVRSRVSRSYALSRGAPESAPRRLAPAAVVMCARVVELSGSDTASNLSRIMAIIKYIFRESPRDGRCARTRTASDYVRKSLKAVGSCKIQ